MPRLPSESRGAEPARSGCEIVAVMAITHGDGPGPGPAFLERAPCATLAWHLLAHSGWATVREEQRLARRSTRLRTGGSDGLGDFQIFCGDGDAAAVAAAAAAAHTAHTAPSWSRPDTAGPPALAAGRGPPPAGAGKRLLRPA